MIYENGLARVCAVEGMELRRSMRVEIARKVLEGKEWTTWLVNFFSFKFERGLIDGCRFERGEQGSLGSGELRDSCDGRRLIRCSRINLHPRSPNGNRRRISNASLVRLGTPHYHYLLHHSSTYQHDRRVRSHRLDEEFSRAFRSGAIPSRAGMSIRD